MQVIALQARHFKEILYDWLEWYYRLITVYEYKIVKCQSTENESYVFFITWIKSVDLAKKMAILKVYIHDSLNGWIFLSKYVFMSAYVRDLMHLYC
jgi:hypothetical protein